jgi:hypothetical protein
VERTRSHGLRARADADRYLCFAARLWPHSPTPLLVSLSLRCITFAGCRSLRPSLCCCWLRTGLRTGLRSVPRTQCAWATLLGLRSLLRAPFAHLRSHLRPPAPALTVRRRAARCCRPPGYHPFAIANPPRSSPHPPLGSVCCPWQGNWSFSRWGLAHQSAPPVCAGAWRGLAALRLRSGLRLDCALCFTHLRNPFAPLRDCLRATSPRVAGRLAPHPSQPLARPFTPRRLRGLVHQAAALTVSTSPSLHNPSASRPAYD